MHFFVPFSYASISNTLHDTLPRAALSQLHTHIHTHTHTHSLPAHLTIRPCPSSFARFLPLLQLDNCFTAQALCCVAFLKPRIEKQHRASQACFSPLPRYFLRLARPIPRTRSGALGFVCRHHGQQDNSKTRSRTHSLTRSHSLRAVCFSWRPLRMLHRRRLKGGCFCIADEQTPKLGSRPVFLCCKRSAQRPQLTHWLRARSVES